MKFGLPELTIVLIIVLLLFGSTRLPKLSRSIGQSIRELREGFSAKTPSSEPSAEIKKPEPEKNNDGSGTKRRPRGRPKKV